MMEIQFDNGSEKIYDAKRKFSTNHERDMFVYRLVGAMTCYLDRETLERCIESAMDGYNRIPEEKAS